MGEYSNHDFEKLKNNYKETLKKVKHSLERDSKDFLYINVAKNLCLLEINDSFYKQNPLLREMNELCERCKNGKASDIEKIKLIAYADALEGYLREEEKDIVEKMRKYLKSKGLNAK